jgi:DNA (cytosine-5)-methyltransferase 1
MGDVRNAHGAVRAVDEPSATITSAMDNGNFQWVRDPEKMREQLTEHPERVNNQSGTVFDLAWPAEQPAPAVAGRGLVGMPGANANRFNGSTKSRNDGVRVTVAEAGILQSFRADYPWTGTITKQYEQVGNSVPPLLGQAMIETVLGIRQAARKAA